MKKLLLLISSIALVETIHAQCAELFISEYLEGSGNNKGVEIYNPTSSPINLSSYILARYSNGGTTIADQVQLSGTIAPGGVWVVVNGQTTTTPSSPACDTAMQALADQLDGVYPAPTYFNGDDALTLEKNGVKVDIFGKIGEDPGTAWTNVFPYTDAAGTWLTANHTLIRKRSVMQGVTTNPADFNALAEWDTIPVNKWDSLGSHTCDCGVLSVEEKSNKSYISVFPNPVKNDYVTIKSKDIIKSVELFGALGNLITSREFKNGVTETVIETKNLPKGIYLIKTRFDNGRETSERIISQ